MRLSNEYDVRAPIDLLWDVLNDVERVAPFVPGFDLQEAEGDTYRGTVKVKVGAVTVSYDAEIEVLERDAERRQVAMSISGRERRGPGSMKANVRSTLTPEGASTKISLITDLQVTGRVAQFGGGVLADVGTSLLSQFVVALEHGLLPPGGLAQNAAASSPTAPASDSASSRPAPAPSQASASPVLDVTSLVTGSVTRRIAPLVIGAAMIAVVSYLIGRRR